LRFEVGAFDPTALGSLLGPFCFRTGRHLLGWVACVRQLPFGLLAWKLQQRGTRLRSGALQSLRAFWLGRLYACPTRRELLTATQRSSNEQRVSETPTAAAAAAALGWAGFLLGMGLHSGVSVPHHRP